MIREGLSASRRNTGRDGQVDPFAYLAELKWWWAGGGEKQIMIPLPIDGGEWPFDCVDREVHWSSRKRDRIRTPSE